MTLRTKLILVLLAMVGAFAAGRYTLPSKIVEKETIKYVDKIVEKIVEVDISKRHKHRVYVKLVTVKPDGTRTEETKIFDDDRIEITQNMTSDKKEDKQLDNEKEKSVVYVKNDWNLSLGVKTDFSLGIPSYGLLIQRRIIGPFYLGAFGFTDKSFGATLGIIF